MGWIVFVLFIGVLAYIALQKSGKAKPPTARADRTTDTEDHTERLSIAANARNEDVTYLKAKWSAAEKERSAGVPSTFPKWFFDAPTEKQLKRIADDGLNPSGVSLTKGAASDLIGLLEPLEDHQVEILKFFKVPIKGMNQTRGRYEITRLLADAANLTAWNERPATAMQKEFFKFHGLPSPKGLTSADATALINDHQKNLPDDETGNLTDWEYFESIVEQLADKETRDDYNLKKPTMPAIRAAVDALRADGNSLEDIDADLQLVADKLIAMSPELER